MSAGRQAGFTLLPIVMFCRVPEIVRDAPGPTGRGANGRVDLSAPKQQCCILIQRIYRASYIIICKKEFHCSRYMVMTGVDVFVGIYHPILRIAT